MIVSWVSFGLVRKFLDEVTGGAVHVGGALFDKILLHHVVDDLVIV